MKIFHEPSRFQIISHVVNYTSGGASLHLHERYEICQLLSDRLDIFVGDRQINVGRGDIVAIPEHMIHRFSFVEDSTVARIIQFPTKLLFGFGGTVKPLIRHITREEMEKIPDFFDNATRIMEIMDREYGAESAEKNPFLASLVISLYLLLMKYFSAQDEDGMLQKRDHDDFYRITSYINEHFKEDITVESVAKEMYVSRSGITSVFKKYAGTTVKDYINTLRVKNVNRLLLDGKNITEAAHECGFQNVRTLNNVYKRVMNMTPTEFLRRHGKDQ